MSSCAINAHCTRPVTGTVIFNGEVLSSCTKCAEQLADMTGMDTFNATMAASEPVEVSGVICAECDRDATCYYWDVFGVKYLCGDCEDRHANLGHSIADITTQL